jgi:hypothetical protein
VVARFVEGLRQLNGVVAGATEMPWRRFVVFNAIGAAAWVGVWATAGYLAGDHITTITAAIHRYLWFAIGALVVAIGGYVLFHRSRRRRHRTGKGRASASAVTTAPTAAGPLGASVPEEQDSADAEEPEYIGDSPG